jgi:hypothetical protein
MEAWLWDGRVRPGDRGTVGTGPRYRQSGWPIGSGETEASVKQFNKRVKGTEQLWTEAGIEPIPCPRAAWVSQDERWQYYWDNRPAYVK